FFAASLKASASAMYIAEVIAFFFAGRLTVTRRIFPVRSVIMSLMIHLFTLAAPHLSSYRTRARFRSSRRRLRLRFAQHSARAEAGDFVGVETEFAKHFF